ncbi:MAG: sigma-70 family RNA polymerase sigma factor [Acidimicrobiales bacterium]
MTRRQPAAALIDEPDEALVRAVQAGDVSAFGQLFKRHFTSVRLACSRRLEDPSDAEDVAQAAMVRALERIGQCRGDRMFGPWVHVIAQRMCTDSYRAGLRYRSVAELLAGTHVADFADPEEGLLKAERQSEMWRALGTLSPRQRRVVIARDINEQRPPEIAAGMGMSTGAVDSLLMRARRRLAAAYEAGPDGHRRPGPVPMAGALLLGGWHQVLRRVWSMTGHVRNFPSLVPGSGSPFSSASWVTKAAVSAVVGATTSVLILPGMLGTGPALRSTIPGSAALAQPGAVPWSSATADHLARRAQAPGSTATATASSSPGAGAGTPTTDLTSTPGPSATSVTTGPSALGTSTAPGATSVANLVPAILAAVPLTTNLVSSPGSSVPGHDSSGLSPATSTPVTTATSGVLGLVSAKVVALGRQVEPLTRAVLPLTASVR